VNRRLLVFVFLAVAALVVGTLLMRGRTPTQAPPPVTTPSTADSTSVPPRAAAPAPQAKAPVEPPRAAEPRRRTAPAPPKTAAAPEVTAAIPSAEAAMLNITVDVPDAQVFVDRVFLGKAPLMTTDVKPGSHRLNVSATGYEGVAQSIDVKPGMQQVAVKLREVRLDASIDVVHKHRMGSCKGRLIATPAGMRYETTDHDDAFKAALLDIDTFDVDYLNKNLRLKLRQGKRFDFTDPDGNADRLFVFQRDVEKARERLKKGDPPAQE
jgi:hypothetical protein